MQNKKPKTIADLNINLNFCKTEKFHPFLDFQTKFIENNPKLENYKIVPDIYYFEADILTNSETIDEEIKLTFESIEFNITLSPNINCNLINLLYKIDHEIHKKIVKNSIFNLYKLDKIIESMTNRNSFYIDLCSPTERK